MLENQKSLSDAFLMLVLSEIKSIRLNTKKSIVSKLNMKRFNGTVNNSCVYGQMFGSSLFDSTNKIKHQFTNSRMESDTYAPVSSQEFYVVELEPGNFNFYTPLERYAFHAPKNKLTNLFPYLKGRTDVEPTIEDLK